MVEVPECNCWDSCLIIVPRSRSYSLSKAWAIPSWCSKAWWVALARSSIFMWSDLARSVVTGASAFFSPMKMGTFALKASVDTQVFVVPPVVLRDPPYPLLL
ncbi:hypothetical protein KIL84_000579 [Mauremys mutica]|uniref:Uncharacterized protein n=1 Tax=Mauremys mutica TaxID=74926 RepID=A0A9D3WWU7_9SAUR|nr:hypothetical protein KIL84_000579 [Mauremys mutica]